METVELTRSELIVGAQVGMMRNAEARLRNSRPRFSEKVPGELWGFHIEGACAELAFCKLLGIRWDRSVDTFHVPDIPGYRIDVRWSQRSDAKVRPDDNGVYIVKMGGMSPRFTYQGWIYSEHAKVAKWKKDFGRGNPAYFVPVYKLRQDVPSLLAQAREG